MAKNTAPPAPTAGFTVTALLADEVDDRHALTSYHRDEDAACRCARALDATPGATCVSVVRHSINVVGGDRLPWHKGINWQIA